MRGIFGPEHTSGLGRRHDFNPAAIRETRLEQLRTFLVYLLEGIKHIADI
jgi:hypothetical protein